MRLLRAAAVANLFVLALSGCSGDGPPDTAPASPPSTSTSEPSTPLTTPSDTPTEPPLPDAATKATEAGARAFITYYWDLINYAQATGDVESLKAVSADDCDGCNAGIAGISDLYGAGGHLAGGDYTVAIIKLNQLAVGSTNFAFEARLTVRNTKQTVVPSTEPPSTNPAGRSSVDVALLWRQEAWRLEAMEVS